MSGKSSSKGSNANGQTNSGAASNAGAAAGATNAGAPGPVIAANGTSTVEGAPGAVVPPAVTLSLVDQMALLKREQESLEAKAREIEAARNTRMAGIHTEFGFGSSDEFLKTYKLVVTNGANGANGSGNGSGSGFGRGGKSKVTDVIRNQIAEMAKAGKTGAEMAKATNLSVPTIQNVKKALGLVRSR